MTDPNLFDLESANAQAHQEFQDKLRQNYAKYNKSVLTAFACNLFSPRVLFVISQYISVNLERYSTDCIQAGTSQNLIETWYKQIESSDMPTNIILEDNKLVLVIELQLHTGLIVAYVKSLVDEPGYVSMSTILCEQLEALGILNPDVEVYFS